MVLKIKDKMIQIFGKRSFSSTAYYLTENDNEIAKKASDIKEAINVLRHDQHEARKHYVNVTKIDNNQELTEQEKSSSRYIKEAYPSFFESDSEDEGASSNIENQILSKERIKLSGLFGYLNYEKSVAKEFFNKLVRRNPQVFTSDANGNPIVKPELSAGLNTESTLSEPTVATSSTSTTTLSHARHNTSIINPNQPDISGQSIASGSSIPSESSIISESKKRSLEDISDTKVKKQVRFSDEPDIAPEDIKGKGKLPQSLDDNKDKGKLAQSLDDNKDKVRSSQSLDDNKDKGKSPQSSEDNKDKGKSSQSVSDFLDSLPLDYNPFDDIGSD